MASLVKGVKSSKAHYLLFIVSVRALSRLLAWRNHREPWPGHHGFTYDLLNVIVKRINEVSGLYQMFHMLADVIALRK